MTKSTAETLNAETPLHYYHGKSSGTSDGVIIEECGIEGHLIIRGQADDQQLQQTVTEVVGVKLPLTPNHFHTINDRTIYWRSPNEWLLHVPSSELASIHESLQNKVTGHVALVDVSAGQTRLVLRGSGIETVLQKSSVYDFHDDNFPVGKSVQTTFAKAGALVSRKEQDSVELIIRRSFSDYIAAWLLDAGADAGCKIRA